MNPNAENSTPEPEKADPPAAAPEKHDPVAGKQFFTVLCGLLLLLVAVYVYLHKTAHSAEEPLSVQLLEVATKAREATGDEDPAAAIGKVLASTRRRLEPMLEVNGMASVADRLVASLTEAQKLVAAEDGPAPEEEIDNGDKKGDDEEEMTAAQKRAEAARVELAKINGLIVEVAENEVGVDPLSASPSYFWRTRPWLYLEIFLWALAGILVHLIVTSGVYMRKGKFFKPGIWQHIALLIAAPFLTFVFVTLLSLVTLNISISDQPAEVDFSDPRLLVAVSFLVASRPWALWDFLKATAKTFFKSVDD